MHRSIETRPQQFLRSAPTWNLSPASPASVAQARRQVTRTLRDWSLPELVEDAVLIVSELVTNAICHGASPVWHTMHELRLGDGSVLVRLVVGDGGTGCRPGNQSPGTESPEAEVCPDETSGRGLGIVDALAGAWTVFPSLTGHQVWAELPAGPCPDGPADAGRYLPSRALWPRRGDDVRGLVRGPGRWIAERVLDRPTRARRVDRRRSGGVGGGCPA